MKKETENKNSYFANIIITQGICLVFILLCVISLKFISKSDYKKLKNFYQTEICANTSVSEVLE